MNYLPPAPGQGQPQPEPPRTPEEQRNHEAERILEELLGGEIPGKGYLFPDDPKNREQALIVTEPTKVRDQLLRSIETMAVAAQLPYGSQKIGELGKAILECAQAYLLLDPTVDENGVPIGAQAEAQGTQDRETAEHGADMQARVAAHASGEEFTRAQGPNGYVEPPRVKPNPAEEAVALKHEAQTKEIQGARADKPLPKPRVGS